MYGISKKVPTKGLNMNTGYEKTTVMGYRTLFEGSGIHNSNSGLQITHEMYMIYLTPIGLTPGGSSTHLHTNNT